MAGKRGDGGKEEEEGWLGNLFCIDLSVKTGP